MWESTTKRHSDVLRPGSQLGVYRMIHSGVAPLRHRAICTFPNGAEEGASRRSAENLLTSKRPQ